MAILDDLMSILNFDTAVKDIRQGIFHTGVLTRNCGLAATLPRDALRQEPPMIKEPGFLLDKDPRELARKIDLFILDHHLLRCTEGITWLDQLSTAAGKRVLCAADFMCKSRTLMEAERESLYRSFPVPEDWHEDYAKGKATTENYR